MYQQQQPKPYILQPPTTNSLIMFARSFAIGDLVVVTPDGIPRDIINETQPDSQVPGTSVHKTGKERRKEHIKYRYVKGRVGVISLAMKPRNSSERFEFLCARWCTFRRIKNRTASVGSVGFGTVGFIPKHKIEKNNVSLFLAKEGFLENFHF